MVAKNMDSEYGVLTLAIPKDYKKAIAMALTLKEHSPTLPVSIVCPKNLRQLVAPYFDLVIDEREDLRGFEHKLYLDQYSPYQNTFFFDADILIIKDIMPIIERWSGNAYAVRGHWAQEGVSSFGLNRKNVLELLKKKSFAVIDGAGHAYFEKPGCETVFDACRNIRNEFSIYGATRFADEDAVGIALTLLNISPKENDGFLGSPWCAINNSFKIDTDKSLCDYEDLLVGRVEPYIVHFPTFAYPFTYARELSKTFRRHNIKVTGLWLQAFKEWFILRVYWPLLGFRKKITAILRKRFSHFPV
jgi:hypothetical protein